MDKYINAVSEEPKTLDNNGYAPSLMSTRQICYFCGTSVGKIDRHEVFFGNNRGNSKAFGTWCNLCRRHHDLVHKGDGTFDLWLKREAQKAFEKKYSHSKFMKIFGRNYL